MVCVVPHIIVISYHIIMVDLKQQNRLKVGTDKPAKSRDVVSIRWWWCPEKHSTVL